MVQSTTAREIRGYTIVEVLVVLAVLALLTLIAVPWFLKLSQRQALKSAAREIQITLNAARMTAVKRNAPVSVAFLSLTPPVRMQIIEPAPPAPTPTIPPSQLVLPQNAARVIETPKWSSGTIIFGGDGRLQRTPAATAAQVLTPSVITLEGPVNGGARNRVEIQTYERGSVKVVTPVDWQ
jgi:prepilin-type N-terminal cleavage/methylation domain-containing protein